ncbi:hypothetical protein WISP_150650 [Willisornis vidua]|uniref:TGF-beta propeptide domain-containing protein n=1 Tax=Willisornis vidua TaxID=1566151 RepID=A0ABQ9CPU0_9PASS|nr:hypothetical protein WISP_150650 [Willisornis vidua]
MVKGLEEKPYEEQLEGTWSVQPGEEETEGRLHGCYNFLVGERGGAGTDLFPVVSSDRTQGNGLKLCQKRFRLDIRKRLFPQRVVGLWNRLPRGVITAPSQTEFKKCLSNALRHMMKLLGVLLCRAELDSTIPEGPFQLGIFCDPVILVCLTRDNFSKDLNPEIERDKDFSHQRRHYKEFRFDLTQIPHGEAVTAAEFRIYKDRSNSRFENETIQISVYQIIKEYPNRDADLFLLDTRKAQASDVGWFVFDITVTSNHWVINPLNNLGLQLCVEMGDGRSINVKSAGLIGRHGPQSKQPFMVAFFKASEVLFRSVRATNNKRKNQNRNKSSSQQESSRMPSVGDYNTSEQKQACKKHELYVSFRDLGWQCVYPHSSLKKEAEVVFANLQSKITLSRATEQTCGIELRLLNKLQDVQDSRMMTIVAKVAIEKRKSIFIIKSTLRLKSFNWKAKDSLYNISSVKPRVK